MLWLQPDCSRRHNEVKVIEQKPAKIIILEVLFKDKTFDLPQIACKKTL